MSGRIAMSLVDGNGSMRELVDLEQGTISREIFVSEAIYQQELEQIFARAWLFVGHESEAPNPDDYVVSRMGEESVILTRDRQGQLHVLLNSCRHRGMKVCRYDAGNTRLFTCPYHGWSYSTDGSLVSTPGDLLGVPQYKAAYHKQLRKQDWGLVHVAQMVNYKGTIWATWDPAAPSFFDYLGDMIHFLDAALDHRDGREGGSEVIGGVYKWRLPCNWKFAAENFIGDMYHTISHQSVEIVGIGPGGPGQSRQGVVNPGGRPRPGHVHRRSIGSVSFPDLGHGALGGPPQVEDFNVFPEFLAPSGPVDNIPVVAEYFREVAEERRKRLAGRSVAWGGPATIFPNMSYHARIPRTIAVWHPVGPNMTEGWRWCLVDKDAPAEVKDLLRHHFMRYSGPAGLTEEDDMENWNYAHEASRGTIARRYPYNYQMGMGWERPLEGLRDALVTEETTEQNQRGFYRRWAQMMEAMSWDELMPR
jgi:phenylpropionate dioxygenase-like ring-hydroxylating dioxygenase large terminal subunit